MEPRDLEKLLGGYATNTLTNEERQALFDAALHDQTLFNTLADEQALKELLDHPQHRQQLLRSLQQSQPETRASWLSQALAWTQQSSNIAIAGSVVVALLAFTFVVRLIDDVGPVPSSLDSKRGVKPPAPTSKPMPFQPTEPAPPVTPSVPPNEPPLTPSDSKRSSSTRLEASPQAPLLPAPSLMAKRKSRAVANRAGEEAQDEAESELADIPVSALSEMDGPTAKDRLSPQNGWRISARELFYQTTPKIGTEHQSIQGRRQAFSRMRPESTARSKSLPTNELSKIEQFADASTQPGDQETLSAQLKASKPEIRKFHPSDTPKEEPSMDVLPLGLRYSLLQQQPDGTFSEVDISTPRASTEMVQLTVETNQPGYLYVFRSVDKKWRVLFPFGLEGPSSEDISALVEGRTRYTIPFSESLHGTIGPQSHVTIIFSRKSLLKIDEVLRSVSAQPLTGQPQLQTVPATLLIEQTNLTRPDGSTENAVYVADAASPSASHLDLYFPLYQK